MNSQELIQRLSLSFQHSKNLQNLNLLFSFSSQPNQQTKFLSVFSSLQLVYHVQWPLNIIFSSLALEKYSKIFALLLRLKEVSQVILSIPKQFSKDQQANILRFEMIRFLQGFQV